MRFISIVPYRDYLVAITEDGDLYKITISPLDGTVIANKIAKLR